LFLDDNQRCTSFEVAIQTGLSSDRFHDILDRFGVAI
jgi:hypothetical protein